ncbi:tripartite motif-containing protein 45-like isoform X2 [Mercenaria mercenaria]|uniref:tripartite motif-containing protein 45-like isoform X2 n=1 Tax=Mercenaria mercenaria TaxID=6596 RepID=UPI00234F4731|nr:tripartite motif-containing protein 45-like isoform X2 [Mercenaria mercenaria]
MEKCPLCFGTFQKPKILPCLDSMCFACLDEYVIKNKRSTGTFPCPVCNIELPVPDGGITNFDDNQHIRGEQMLETVANVKPPCEVCDEKQDAAQRCIDCEQNFCNHCSKAHLRLTIAKTHTLVNLDGAEGRRYLVSTGYCDKHKNEELTFYCRTCQIPVCMRCRLTVHEDHTTEDLVDFAVRTRKDLKVALDENKGYRFNMLNEIEELRVYKEKMAEKKNITKKSIMQRRQQFHKAIDNVCDDMLERLETKVSEEQQIVDEDKDLIEQNMLTLSHKIATANQMVDFGSDIEVVRNRFDILGSLALAKKDVPLSMTGIKLNVDFACQKQAELSLKYLIGRLSTDIVPPTYICVSEVSTFRVENTSDVINSICPSPDGNCWIACGWKSEIILFDRFGKRTRMKKVGRDVDCLSIDTDGNSYVSCRDEHSVKRFDRNFRRRMATLNIECPRGIATTNDNKLVICVNNTTTYFDYEPSHQNKVLKLGPDGDESKELKNPSLYFMYPIRVAVNINDELCVSDNLKHAVMFLRPNGELKSMYAGNTKTSEIVLVKSPTRTNLTTAKTATSTPRPGAVSFKLPESRKEQDGPLEGTPKSIMDRAHTPVNSPKTVQASEKALAPINLSYESTFDSSVTLESSSKQIVSPEKQVPAYVKALTGMTGGTDSASVTDVDSENEFIQYMPPFDPRGITCDKYGHVIVADYSSNMIHLLDKHGRFLMYLLTENDGIFGPTSVAVDNSGLLWVGGGDATVKIYRYINLEEAGY